MIIPTLKGFWQGALIGFRWYAIRIKESKWYLIPFILDMVLIPAKVIIIAILRLMSNGFRSWNDNAAVKMENEVEG